MTNDREQPKQKKQLQSAQHPWAKRSTYQNCVLFFFGRFRSPITSPVTFFFQIKTRPHDRIHGSERYVVFVYGRSRLTGEGCKKKCCLALAGLQTHLKRSIFLCIFPVNICASLGCEFQNLFHDIKFIHMYINRGACAKLFASTQRMKPIDRGCRHRT